VTVAGDLGHHLLALDGDIPDKALIGGKAWSIARMRSLGLNVPPAIVITTDACREYMDTGMLPDALSTKLAEGIQWLEKRTGRTFGGGAQPLLLSVRSGSAVSLPGMMDTILNLGISDETEVLLARACGDQAFARDTHRRFLTLFASIVLKAEVELDPSSEPAAWRKQIAAASGAVLPIAPIEQLDLAIKAVFDSWNSRRARRYRAHNGIDDALGTACTIQAMVFGNLDDRSGTGVLFSRNPLTGEPRPYGEFLSQAQGEDIVSGKYTPQPLEQMYARVGDAADELLKAARILEDDGCDVQDIEFTVERGRLFLLQTRAAKRAPQAALRIAVDFVAEGRISETQALSLVSPEQVRTLVNWRLADGAELGAMVLARGIAASPGIGVGILVADADEAEARARAGEEVVLARQTTSPHDLHGMIAARAIVTEQGGSTSHAAVVGRALGRPCVVGCGEKSLADLIGRLVTVDGAAGVIYNGALPVVRPNEDEDPMLRQLADWARCWSPVEVLAEAPDGVIAIEFDRAVDDGPAIAAALAALPPAATVAGQIFANDASAVHAAVAAGVDAIVTRPVLPALLAAAQASLRSGKRAA
jgi:pyruvate,orthophosphate dikinase